jgi:hypothetical protein
VEQPPPGQSGGERNVKMGWVITIVLIVFIVWAIYLSTQMAVVESGSRTMPGMTHEASPTQMPADMPGMDH